MIKLLLGILTCLSVFFRSRYNLGLEILALRQQLGVLRRKHPRPHLRAWDRLFWILLRRLWLDWSSVLVIVKPETVVSWHRVGFRLFWRIRSHAEKSRQTKNQCRNSGCYPTNGGRECNLGCSENPWRTSQTRLRCLGAFRVSLSSPPISFGPGPQALGYFPA